MQFIDQAEVARRLPYATLVPAMAKGLLEPIESPLRSAFNPNHDASAVLIMSAWKPRRFMGVKLVSIWPGNNAKNLPSVSAVYVLSSCEDGTALAVIDGTELTARRTAATAALGAQLLARADSKKLLVLGTGALSAHMAQAHHSVFNLTDITIWGRQLDKAQAVVESLAKRGIKAHASTDLQASLADCDVAVAATTATTPFIRSEWIKPGTHLGLVGAFTPDMAEAQPELLPRTRLFVDTREDVQKKGGEVLQALRAGLISQADILGELAELVPGPAQIKGRHSDQDITVFKSVGFAALDLIAAEHLFQQQAAGSA